MRNSTIKNGPYGKRHLLPGMMPFIVGALLYATVLAPLISEPARIPFLVVSFGLAMAVTAVLSAAAAAFRRTGIERWRLMLPPLLLVAGAFLFHLLVGMPLARFAIVTAVMLLLFSYVMRLDVQRPMDDAARDTVLNHGRFISLMGLFFLSVFAFGIGQFVYMPTVVLAAAMGALTAVIAYEDLLQVTALAPKIRYWSCLALGLVGVELFIGLSFLPTSFLVNAAVFLTAQFACVRLAAGALGGFFGKRSARIGAIAALALIVSVLASARWN